MRNDFWDRPAFETVRPRRPKAPLVFNAAHSGRDYPARFLALSALDAREVRQSEDAFVDELFAAAPHLGAPLLRARFPRAYLDVNREPWELDPDMFAERLPAAANTGSARVAAGLGTIARIVAENKPIYRDRLSLADARMRIEGIYLPYHRTLQDLLGESLTRFGAALLIDCHSMPRLSRSNGGPPPDFVLGDRYGVSCAPALTGLAETCLTGLGFRVTRNRPYAGGHIARTYGRPRNGVHVLQIEISRHLYMKEGTLLRHDGFAAIQTACRHLASTLVTLAPDLMLPRHADRLRRAAE